MKKRYKKKGREKQREIRLEKQKMTYPQRMENKDQASPG